MTEAFHRMSKFKEGFSVDLIKKNIHM
ncbi:MAG: hypothetical protein K0R34_2733, partial [Herbinix sp.]|nr:hypothetical protein [Herbinix sp.]